MYAARRARLDGVMSTNDLNGAGKAHTILRLPVVKARTGLSRSTIYFRAAQGTFPKPVSLGGRAVGWLEAEIQDWLARCIEARGTPAEKRPASPRT
jgi:prophage regulatory protein